jgi:DNA-binding NarL/FixJ family response regulator
MQTASVALSARPGQAPINVALHGIPPLLRYALNNAVCEFDDPRHVLMQEECADEADQRGEGLEEPDVVVVLGTARPASTLNELKRATDRHPAARMLVLALKPDDGDAVRLIRSGAHGYISIGEEPIEFVTAIAAIAGGSVFVSPSLQALVAERYLSPDEAPEKELTARELVVLRMLTEGMRNEDIASILFIGVKTVDTHRMNLMRKLGLRTNVELVHFAIRRQLIEL